MVQLEAERWNFERRRHSLITFSALATRGRKTVAEPFGLGL